MEQLILLLQIMRHIRKKKKQKEWSLLHLELLV